MDTVAGYAGYFDWQALRDEILLPGVGHADVTRPPFTAGTADVVIVEGVLTTRPELEGHYDLTVFVDTPAQTCLRRQHERGKSPERRAWIARWAPSRSTT